MVKVWLPPCGTYVSPGVMVPPALLNTLIRYVTGVKVANRAPAVGTSVDGPRFEVPPRA